MQTAKSNPTILSGKIFGFKAKNGKYSNYLGWEAFSNPADDPHADAMPRINPLYQFRKELTLSVLNFLSRPNGDTLFLTGPTGSGKTSLITQVCARLNWHVREITCSQSLDINDLVGCYVMEQQKGLAENGEPKPPVMRFVYGPLVTAMRHGDVLLLNEFDTADPGRLAALNTVMEGGSLLIKETGEIIHPHPMFRIVLTGNSAGQGDVAGSYQGVLAQNLATMDRCRVLIIDYPTKSQEIKTLKSLGIKILDDEMLDRMVTAANALRKEFQAGAIPVTCSTRTLIRWARLILDKEEEAKPISVAFDEALLNRVSELADRTSILKTVKGCFPEGTAW